MMRAAAGAAVLAFVLSGCSEPTSTDRPAAPVSLRATVVLEPPRLEIGETASVEVVVATPPDHAVAPVANPEPIDGVWILSAEAPQVERSAVRWLHRFRFSVRARRTGEFVWPAQRIEIETPSGEVQLLETEERGFEITEISREYPAERSFFGYRDLPERESRGGFFAPAAAGALSTLFCVALFALVRRVRRSRQGEQDDATRASPEAGSAPWRGTQATLAAADEVAETDPSHAADMASAALRLYLEGRYGASLLTRTTEEAAQDEPPFALTSRWSEIVSVLGALDAIRFVPAEETSERSARLHEAVGRARALVGDGTASGFRR